MESFKSLRTEQNAPEDVGLLWVFCLLKKKKSMVSPPGRRCLEQLLLDGQVRLPLSPAPSERAARQGRTMQNADSASPWTACSSSQKTERNAPGGPCSAWFSRSPCMQDTLGLLQGSKEEAGLGVRGIQASHALQVGLCVGVHQHGLWTLTALPLTNCAHFEQITKPCQPEFPHL